MYNVSYVVGVAFSYSFRFGSDILKFRLFEVKILFLLVTKNN